MSDETTEYLEGLLHDRGMTYTKAKRDEREKLRAEMQALVRLIKVKEHNEMELENMSDEQKGKLLTAILDDDLELAKSLMAEPQEPEEDAAGELETLSAEYNRLAKAPTANKARLAELEPQLEQLWTKAAAKNPGMEKRYYGAKRSPSLDKLFSLAKYGPDEVEE